jgi:hypothetical protein
MKTSLIIIAALSLLTGFTATTATAEDLPDVQYHGYKVVHHMTAVIEHMDKFGFNTFDHPRIADYRAFVITPALDHFYSKAVTDVRWGPVIVDTPAKDDRYSSFQIFDMEHHTVYDKVINKEGERFVLIHQDYNGKVPEGTVVKVNCNFPFIFMRTQSFAFNEDKLANAIRYQARIYGAWQMPDLPKPQDTKAVIQWVIDNSNLYKQTEKLMKKAAKTYSMDVHKETFENLKGFLASGGVSGNVGGFEAVDDPAGGTMKIRAACCLLGHLGFPVHHAYYQQIPMNSAGKLLSGANGPFVLTLPYDPGVSLFWSVTRYGADTFLPLNPAYLGGHNIQAYNAFNTEPDAKGNVTFTFSKADPKNGTYWMPVTDAGYYLIARYYGPTKALNGNTAKDIIYKGTKLEQRFETVKF